VWSLLIQTASQARSKMEYTHNSSSAVGVRYIGLVVASQLETCQPVDEGVPEKVVGENGGCVAIG
jgi:hypothetical protein